MNETKNYTAADFARYHAGTMPPAEMHALEKAALEDPFLGDALEGYALTAAPAADAASLRERLDNLTADKKIFFLSPKAGWWRIAALFIIIIGAGVLFFTVNNKIAKNNGLAQNEKSITSSGKPADSIVPSKSDTAYKTVETTTNNSIVVPADNLKLAETKQASSLYSPATPPANEDAVSNAAAKPLQSDAFQNSQQTYSVNTRPYNNNAVQNNASTNNGYDKVQAANANQQWAKNNTQAKSFQLNPPATPNNADEKKDVSLQDVVTAAGISRKAKETPADEKRAIFKDSSNVNVAADIPIFSKKETAKFSETVISTKDKNIDVGISGVSSVPGSGMSPEEKTAFDKYLKDNMQPVYNQSGGRMAGEVLLSFRVNKKGRPKDIKVGMSLCPPCEAQAIKLLENGPDWNAKKNEEKTVIIKF